MSVLHEMLENKILPFWKGLIDNENGGYYGYVGYDLAADKTAVKGCILNSRILWFFSNAKEPEYAAHAYKFLRDYCIDKENGGVFWSVNADGSPADTTKHCYNQAFAIYALAAYYELSGDKDALKLADELFDIIESRCTDPGGYGEAYERDWKPAGNEKLSENGVEAGRTMNTLLHVFEAYSGLYQARPSEKIAGRMRFILGIYRDKVFNHAAGRQEVFFDKDYNSLINLTSYGHDIESSWLMDWGTRLLNDDALTADIGAINSRLAGHVYDRAYHNHSLWNECEDGKEDKTRVWWVQAEAALGFYNEYQKSGDGKYLAATREILEYINDRVVDKREGSEWFWSVDDDGNPSEKPIVEPWKCPYHNGRMIFRLLEADYK